MQGGEGNTRFTALGKLGAGAYAVVLKAKDAESNMVVALKKIHAIPQSPEELAVLLQEAIILKAACHPNIVRLMDAYQSPSGRVYLVFEMVQKTLARELLFRPQGLPISQVKLLMWQVLQAVAFLHERGILHRDLKPENILLSDEGIIKICDFGFARFTSEAAGDDSSSYAITRWYRAPEVLIHVSEHSRPSRENDPYSYAVDIWALGCVMASLATGQTLMPGLDRADQLRLIMLMAGPLTPAQMAAVAADSQLAAAFKQPAASDMGQLRQRLKQLPLEAVNVISECLQVDPQRRASAAQLLRMPFFDNVEVPPNLAEQLKVAQAAAAGTPRSQRAGALSEPVRLAVASQDSGAPVSNPMTPDRQLGSRPRSSLLGKALSVRVPEDPGLGAGAGTEADKPRDGAPGMLAPQPVRPGQAGVKAPHGLGARARQLLAASPVYRPLMAEVCTPSLPLAPQDSIQAFRSMQSTMYAHPTSPSVSVCPGPTPSIPLQRCTPIAAAGHEDGGLASGWSNILSTSLRSRSSLSGPVTTTSCAVPMPIPARDAWASLQRPHFRSNSLEQTHSWGGAGDTMVHLGCMASVNSTTEAVKSIDEMVSGLAQCGFESMQCCELYEEDGHESSSQLGVVLVMESE